MRRALQALDRRDLTSWLAVSDEDAEVVFTRDLAGAWSARPRGRLQLVRPVLRHPPAVRTTDTEFIDAGADKVLLQYRIDLRGKGSGAKVDFRRWCVVTMRKGRLLRAEWFSDRVDALEAAGLSE